MVKILRALVGKVDNMQVETDNVNRNRNSKKESKGKMRNRNAVYTSSDEPIT